MKISFITGAFSRTGGVGKYSLALAHAFHDNGHTVQVLHDDASAGSETFPFLTAHVPGFTEYKKYAPEADTKALRELSKFSPDIVHVQASMNYKLEAEIRKHYKAVKSLHVYDFCPSGTKFHQSLQRTCTHTPGILCVPRMVYKRCSSDKNPFTLWMFYRRALEAAHNDRQYRKILVASAYVREQAINAGFSSDQVEMAPYYAEPAGAEAMSGGNKAVKTILFTGRIVKEKGLEKLLTAVSYLKHRGDWKVTVDGAGPEVGNLQRFSEKLGIHQRVEWLGWLPSAAHELSYKTADLLVVPSVWPEPFGLVGIEGMSCSKPVIAFNVGGVSDWLENNLNGFLIPPYNVRLMADKIETLLESESLRTKMGAEGRKKAETLYTKEKHLQKLLTIYSSVITKNELLSEPI